MLTTIRHRVASLILATLLLIPSPINAQSFSMLEIRKPDTSLSDFVRKMSVSTVPPPVSEPQSVQETILAPPVTEEPVRSDVYQVLLLSMPSESQPFFQVKESYPISLLTQIFSAPDTQDLSVQWFKTYYIYDQNKNVLQSVRQELSDFFVSKNISEEDLKNYIQNPSNPPYEIETFLDFSNLEENVAILEVGIEKKQEGLAEEWIVREEIPLSQQLTATEQETESEFEKAAQKIKDALQIHMDTVEAEALNQYIFTVKGKVQLSENVFSESYTPRLFYELKKC